MPGKSRIKKPRLEPKPDFETGLNYWADIPADNNGVLGGFGNGTLPRVDALSSRMFILSLVPRLALVPSSLKTLPTNSPSTSSIRTRALDVGAGIGRVTGSVLIHLLDTVEILEPAPHFLDQAVVDSAKWKGLGGVEVDKKMPKKAARFWRGGLAGFDPASPAASADELTRKGFWDDEQNERPEGLKYDVIWCQWCLGHLSTEDLIVFFKAAKAALLPKETYAVIVVKENICPDLEEDGMKGSTVFDDEDSSLTRSDKAWRYAFAQAGLELVRMEVQQGFPDELFPVHMYALR
ncbi:Hydroxyindole-O-methyltransferase and related SAM-dependent methyltransferases [Phaffia rhodozyma]|uniref:Alpha N-terminal protein methyltransferase 1 n=1 Tax=Phaffia rhodozyma TaxID=264483 RepID=A0A0F7SVV7_PHARH|nr:Hydroxyindole-O-methyltransferase and related SAM-dependent methyltransferases [Phaffia rhodozyma]